MTEIDKSKTALLIMDVQNDIVHAEGKYKDFVESWGNKNL